MEYELNWFTLKYDTKCASCKTPLYAGLQGAYFAGEIIGGCCEEDPVIRSHESTTPKHIPVMPRGKTAKDRCDRCFMVHASGQTECE